MVISTFQSAEGVVTQGFHQSNLIIGVISGGIGLDQADIQAFKVLESMGEDPRAVYNSLQKTMPSSRSARCEYEYISTGEEPPFGTIVDNHHATCWRLWRYEQMLAGKEF